MRMNVKLAICNEFCEGWDIERVFALAADTGYQGVEIAPFTLAPDVNEISPGRRRQIAAQAEKHGIEIVGLHWLLASPKGLHLSHPDESIRNRTANYFKDLIRFCGELGGTKMIIGSPQQRNIVEGMSPQQAWDAAKDFFGGMLRDAEQHGVDLCIEPLARAATNFINTAAEGLKLCREIGHRRFRLHLDMNAMSDEGRPLDDIIKQCKGYVGHVHANDANLGYPGSGNTDFGAVAEGLKAIGYDEWVSVEVFDFEPGPEKIAAQSYRYLRGFLA